MEFDDPWDWFRPHTCIEDNIYSSGYDLGIDDDGDVLIAVEGRSFAVELADMQAKVASARREMIDE